MSDLPAPAVKELVQRISERLHVAADAAGAAESCAAVGNLDQALALLSGIESALYDLMTLLNAASILRGSKLM